MKRIHKLTLLLAAVSSMPAWAASGVSFDHKDWEVTCDNTLTCRAAGYSTEEQPSGSILFTRKAGPNTPISGEVILAEVESADKTPKKLTMWIDDKFEGEAKAGRNDIWHLSAVQNQKLIRALKGTGKVEFRGAPDPFILSGDGAYAVMLKMDDIQGRIGTPGAMVKKGDKPEDSVLAAIPAPVIQAAQTETGKERPLTAPELAGLKPKLVSTLTPDDGCDRLQPSPDDTAESDEGITLTPLDKTHALLSTLCWRAAYNEGYGYWVIDNALKEKPVMVTDSGTSYDAGVISLSQKGRGPADCMSMASWVWDGQAFRQSKVADTGMCRYIRLGGTWDLPTFIADVKPAR